MVMENFQLYWTIALVFIGIGLFVFWAYIMFLFKKG